MRSPCIGHIQWSVCDEKFHDNAAADAAADDDDVEDDTDAAADTDDDAMSVGGVRWRDRLIPRDQKSCSERRFENGFYTTDVATMVTNTRNTNTKIQI